jgi:hypothetical protein
MSDDILGDLDLTALLIARSARYIAHYIYESVELGM